MISFVIFILIHISFYSFIRIYFIFPLMFFFLSCFIFCPSRCFLDLFLLFNLIFAYIQNVHFIHSIVFHFHCKSLIKNSLSFHSWFYRLSLFIHSYISFYHFFFSSVFLLNLLLLIKTTPGLKASIIATNHTSLSYQVLWI